MTISLDFALPERRAARRAFDRAVGFDEACVVHDETRARLLERLSFFRVEPRVAVDLGCATGRGALALAQRFPDAHVVAVDSSRGMLAAARAACAAVPAISVVGGEAARLPIASGAAQLVLANLVLPWVKPQVLFAEAARVLEAGGLLLFATLGPDSLQEVRRAWGEVDDRLHVHAAFDMHDLGDLALAAGLGEPVLDVDRLVLTYENPSALVRDLRAWGAVNVAAGRRLELTGPNRWRAFELQLSKESVGGRFPVTVEIVLGQAWGGGKPRVTAPGPAETAVPIERIGRNRGRGSPE